MRTRTPPLLIGIVLLAGCPARDAEDSSDTGEALTWTPITAAGDPVGDCGAEDVTCDADLSQLYWATQNGRLNLDLRMVVSYPSGATLELFLFPPDGTANGHCVRYSVGTFHHWEVDCDVTGCHWLEPELPESFETTGPDGDRFTASVALSDWGFETLDSLGLGAAASFKHIEQREEYTDRYPDTLTYTQDGITDLVVVDL